MDLKKLKLVELNAQEMATTEAGASIKLSLFGFNILTIDGVLDGVRGNTEFTWFGN